MTFQDRQYYNENQSSSFRGPGGGMSFGLPRLTPAVKYLLIANIVIFILQSIYEGKLEPLFCATAFHPWQIWRLLTFQFLHAGVAHLLFNMLGLYFLGTALERAWGARHFLLFYLICGAVAGLLFVLVGRLSHSNFFAGPLIGASGGVLALLIACAILFPQFVVFLFIFPVPIRFAALLFTGLYLLNVISKGANAGGDLCHLGGMAAGFIWVIWGPRLADLWTRSRPSALQRRLQKQAQLQYEVDRILAKVHDQGIHSLTRKEKQILQNATQEQKQLNRF
jgi:membrane associated rhomboid family serine protease